MNNEDVFAKKIVKELDSINLSKDIESRLAFSRNLALKSLKKEKIETRKFSWNVDLFFKSIFSGLALTSLMVGLFFFTNGMEDTGQYDELAIRKVVATYSQDADEDEMILMINDESEIQGETI